MKINSTKSIYKKCLICNSQILIKLYANPTHPDYNQPVVKSKRKITCSRNCHKQWQLSIAWEDRIGKDRAEEIRKARSESSKTNNPSTFPGVAKKISESMKKYLAENPEARLGENNGFFGKKHTDYTKEKLRITKQGKWSYNKEQKEKQTKNTPRGLNHPNWLGGISNGEYGLEFNQKLKEQIKTNYNHTCQICNSKTVDLDIHHIDYNKSNNLLENLIPLCKHCHGKTNYDRETWKNKLTEMKKCSIINDKY